MQLGSSLSWGPLCSTSSDKASCHSPPAAQALSTAPRATSSISSAAFPDAHAVTPFWDPLEASRRQDSHKHGMRKQMWRYLPLARAHMELLGRLKQNLTKRELYACPGFGHPYMEGGEHCLHDHFPAQSAEPTGSLRTTTSQLCSRRNILKSQIPRQSGLGSRDVRHPSPSQLSPC